MIEETTCCLNLSVKDNESEKLDVIEGLKSDEIDVIKGLYAFCVEPPKGRKSAAYACERDAYWSTNYGNWTEFIKITLFKLGREKGYVVYPYPEKNPTQEEWSPWKDEWNHPWKCEWLCDMVWFDTGADCTEKVDPDSWKEMRRVVLACESEWNTSKGAILEDFLKLMVVEADIRLFIYENKNCKPNDRDHPVDYCREAVKRGVGNPQNENTYLLVGFPSYEKKELGLRVDYLRHVPDRM